MPLSPRFAEPYTVQESYEDQEPYTAQEPYTVQVSYEVQEPYEEYEPYTVTEEQETQVDVQKRKGPEL